MTHLSSHNLIDQRTGQRRAPEIVRVIQLLTQRAWCPLSPCEARAMIEAAVCKEEHYFAKRQAESVETERVLVAKQKEARELAALYRFDIELLQFEVDRRSAGSLTLTLDGQQRGLYCEALKIAWEHRAIMKVAAE